MGRLGKRRTKRSTSRAENIRTLALVAVAACVPILGTVFITASTSEPDLSELTPINQRSGNYLLLDWSALLQDRTDVLKSELGIPAGADVQALGYMMDGGRPTLKGEWVQEFLLLPEAGNLLHPAHRIRDQMIAVHLESGARIKFSPRTLVWARGNLQASDRIGVGIRSDAFYVLEKARAELADRRDIQRYFK